MTIDWTKPLEATGKGVPTYHGQVRGQGRLISFPGDLYRWFYDDDGTPPEGEENLPVLRNAPDATPPMYDRLVKLASSICGYADEFCKVARESGDAEMMYARHDTIVVAEARAIMAELSPVDPDLVLAREIVETTIHWSPQTDRDLAAGKNDASPEVKIALAAIKRGRALASGATA